MAARQRPAGNKVDEIYQGHERGMDLSAGSSMGAKGEDIIRENHGSFGETHPTRCCEVRPRTVTVHGKSLRWRLWFPSLQWNLGWQELGFAKRRAVLLGRGGARSGTTPTA